MHTRPSTTNWLDLRGAIHNGSYHHPPAPGLTPIEHGALRMTDARPAPLAQGLSQQLARDGARAAAPATIAT